MKRRPHLLALSCLCAALRAESPPPRAPGVFVFEKAPFPSCHASTLAEARGGGLVAAWFGGTSEGHRDVGIWLARRVRGAWTPPVEVADGRQPDGTRHPCWNPVLFQPREVDLVLFYKVGPSPSKWWGLFRTSADGGQTWSEATRLPKGILGPVKNKPLELPDGAWLSPSSSEDAPQAPAWRVHLERSADRGKNWLRIPVDPGPERPGAIQPSLLTHPDGRLQALGRTRAGRVFETWSADAGRTWTPLALTALPNPNSGTDAVTLRDGRHLLVHNPVAKGRSPLVVSVSPDGRTWQTALVLEDTPSAEFSYPAVIQAADGRVHVSYTWKRQRIRHVEFDAAGLPALR